MESNNTPAVSKNLLLNEQEINLIQEIRALRYGEMRVLIREGKPVQIEEIRKSIKL